MFRVGQKVVCVDAGRDLLGRKSNLVKGQIYTVAGTYRVCGKAAITLCEAEPGDDCIGWFASRFRPIVERKTDISIFTEMLNPARKHEVANG